MPIITTGLKLAAALAFALALGACSTTPTDEAGAGGPGRPGAATPGSPQDFATNIGDRVFFETDSSELTAQAQTTLERQAAWLGRYPRYQIVMEGHADERGTREYNFALSARRGEAARDYLVSKGVPAVRVQMRAYGKERPVAVCNDISCWSQNRRAVTLLGGGAGV